MGYPKLAKVFHCRLGTFRHAGSRTVPYDIQERFWALDAILDRVEQGTRSFRARIAALTEES
jgi:4-hydroxy-tetrahydrodipicolinate synthase